MPGLLPSFESVARIAVAMLVNSLWQGALIALATWGALRLFPKANASTRYAAWGLALLAMVVIPIATSLSRVSIAPSASAITTPYHATSPVAAPKATAVPAGERTRPLHASAPSSTASAVELARSFRLTIPSVVAVAVFAAWVLAALLVLVRLIVAFVHLERLKGDAMPLDVAYRDAMPRWRGAVKGERDIRICVSSEIDVPIAVGIFDSMILLPTTLVESLNAEEIDQITLHELAHLLRNDDWTNGLQRLATALLFFNPAVWFVSRHLDLEREVACDDYVLELTGAVRPYAFCLTKMAEMTSWPHRPLPAPGVFVTRKNISIRIERLLRTGRAIGSRIAPSVASAVVVALVAVFLVLRTMTPSIAFTLPALEAPVVHAPSPAPPRVHVAHVNAPATPVEHIVFKKIVLPVTVAATIRPAPKAPAASRVARAASDAPQSRCSGCNFGSADLAGKDFSGQVLTGSNFGRAMLNGARFNRANVEGTNFGDADLRNASFIDARMNGCNLGGAKLAGARFDGAMMTGCNIDASALDPQQARSILDRCGGCDFGHAHLAGTDLRGLHLNGTNLEYADLRGADLRGARLVGVNFAHVNMNGAHLDGASFIGCNFEGVDLRHVDLSKVNLTGSNMQSAILRD